MVRDTRQGHVLLAVMGVLWGGLLAVAWWAETHPNGPATLAAGAALEGKEVRFGIPGSVLFAVSTTGTSTGAVNSLHDSYTGLGGGVTLLNMLLGEVAPGGVGAGLYGILVLAVDRGVPGRADGRADPGVPGQEARAHRGDRRGDLDPGDADRRAARRPAPRWRSPASSSAALANTGAHGLSEVLYAYASAANNNGSAFAGLTVTSPFFQTTLGLAMLLGRFVPILAVARAGRVARRADARRARRRHPAHPPGRCSASSSAARRPGRRPHLLPGTGPRADRGGPVMSTRPPWTGRSSTASTSTPNGPGAPSVPARSPPASCGARCPTRCASSTRASSSATR